MNIQDLRKSILESEEAQRTETEIKTAKRKLIEAASGYGELSEGDQRRLFLAAQQLRAAENKQAARIASAFRAMTAPDWKP